MTMGPPDDLIRMSPEQTITFGVSSTSKPVSLEDSDFHTLVVGCKTVVGKLKCGHKW